MAGSSSATAVVSVRNLRSKAPTHHQVFWLMQPGADRKNKIHAPRGFLPSHGLPPTMAAFRRKAAQLQIQLRGKPRILTGFLLSARHAAQQRTEGDTMYHIFIYYISLYRTLSTFFSRPTTKCAAAAGASPQAAAARACYPRLRYFTSMIWISAS